MRDNWTALIKALPLAFRPEDPFTHMVTWSPSADFRTWCEANPADCLRHFAIEKVGPRELPIVSNESIERHIANAEIIVAYPRLHGLYVQGSSQQDLEDLEDLIEVEAEQIDDAIGIRGAASYVAGQSYTATEWEIEQGEEVTFLILLVTAQFDRDVS